MRNHITIVVILLMTRLCASRSVVEPEVSVVSVYTTLPTTSGTAAPLDVYHQIANNIAERITSPIYRFLGISRNKTEERSTKKPWDKIEILDEPEDVVKPDLPPVDNDINLPRDVEKVSFEESRKGDKKPEKITLFSSYLPVKHQEANDTGIDDGFFDFGEEDDEFDNDEKETGREGPFIFVLEFIGSIIQLLWGGLLAILYPTRPSSDKS